MKKFKKSVEIIFKHIELQKSCIFIVDIQYFEQNILPILNKQELNKSLKVLQKLLCDEKIKYFKEIFTKDLTVNLDILYWNIYDNIYTTYLEIYNNIPIIQVIELTERD